MRAGAAPPAPPPPPAPSRPSALPTGPLNLPPAGAAPLQSGLVQASLRACLNFLPEILTCSQHPPGTRSHFCCSRPGPSGTNLPGRCLHPPRCQGSCASIPLRGHEHRALFFPPKLKSSMRRAGASWPGLRCPRCQDITWLLWLPLCQPPPVPALWHRTNDQ